ncbi:MAG: DUF4124 domain-containing protein [Gammaproteobacteria bacterium]
MRLTSINFISILLACSLLYAPVAYAFVYKWVDDKGEVHYGDSVPPEFSDIERKKISEQGRTIKTFEAAKTPEEIAEKKRLEVLKLEQQREAEAQTKKDNVLLATYSSEDDLLNTRDSRLASLEGLIQLTQRRIRSMNHRIKQLTEDAADFERSGKPIPEMLTRQIENIRAQTLENESFIVAKKAEQDDIRMKFDKDIQRFRALTKEQPQ